MSRSSNGSVFRKRYRDRHGAICLTTNWYIEYRLPGRPRPVREATPFTKKAGVSRQQQDEFAAASHRKAVDACRDRGVDHLLIGGGVAANSRLRTLAEERAAQHGIRVRVPRPGLCTDNGAMVAALGAEMVARGRTPSSLDLPADSSLPVTSVLA